MDLDGASRNLTVAALLTLSGGYLDAYTYVGHGHVFANTMTGNVALLGINLSAGEWAAALHHVPPLVGFVIAVFVAHLLGLAAQRGWMRHTAFASLIVEIAFLGIAASGLVGASSAWLIPGISFVATLQTLSFTHLEELSYTSVMTTGNLRRAAQKLFVGLIPRYDAGALHDFGAARDDQLLLSRGRGGGRVRHEDHAGCRAVGRGAAACGRVWRNRAARVAAGRGGRGRSRLTTKRGWYRAAARHPLPVRNRSAPVRSPRHGLAVSLTVSRQCVLRRINRFPAHPRRSPLRPPASRWFPVEWPARRASPARRGVVR